MGAQIVRFFYAPVLTYKHLYLYLSPTGEKVVHSLSKLMKIARAFSQLQLQSLLFLLFSSD